MNKITSYVFDGSNVRTLVIDGQPYFVGKDVAEILGYANTRDALSKHVDSEDKNTVAIHDGIKRGNPNQTVINESGLYSLILGSKLPQAKEFKRWVTSEVLPAIRKTGAYQAKPKDNYPIPATYGEALQLAADLQKKVEHDKPKVDYYDSQMRNPGLMTTTVIANDYDMSAREMHQKLHDYGVIYRQGKNWVLYSKYKGQGYAQEEPFPYRNSNNHQGMKPILKWTQKGKKLIYDLFKQHGILPSVEQMELLPG